eukprot:Amastigsp_a175476_23.p4 type:complete len:171 gc:universal Amastigsp_a175476_23:420-932(+)
MTTTTTTTMKVARRGAAGATRTKTTASSRRPGSQRPSGFSARRGRFRAREKWTTAEMGRRRARATTRCASKGSGKSFWTRTSWSPRSARSASWLCCPQSKKSSRLLRFWTGSLTICSRAVSICSSAGSSRTRTASCPMCVFASSSSPSSGRSRSTRTSRTSSPRRIFRGW